MTAQTPRSPKVLEIAPVLPNAAFPAANWADAFEIENCSGTIDMKSLAEQTVGGMPSWARTLLALRNVLVAPLGLKTDGRKDTNDLVAIFPVLQQSGDHIVLGLDDKHVDFRILLERIKGDPNNKLRLTTLVKRHNAFGHAYIALVTPFHKMIVKSVLKNAH